MRMPDSQREQSYPHLPLIKENRSAERKKKDSRFPRIRPDRGGRVMFAPQLNNAVTRIIEERQAKTTPPSAIQPHLVFRVPFEKGVSVDQLIESLQNQTGLEIVSVEPDRAVIAFRDDLDLQEFYRAINTYENGPREGINPQTGKPYATTTADFLEYIEPDQMRLWQRNDRIGVRLKKIIGEGGVSIDQSKRYVVDLELWHPGDSDGARRALNEIRQLVETDRIDGEKVLDTFPGQYIVLVKVAVMGEKLDSLLELDIVSEIDIPPQPIFDRIQAGQVTARDFPIPPLPPEDGPRLCIVDSGIVSNHPLLANNVGHEEAILTQTSSPADANGHGTMVAGLAVFGDVRSCYDSGKFASPITLYSARVLNDNNLFDDEKLIINQMREAIETFRQPPYDCRVFNLSLGSGMPAFDSGYSRQTLWAEEMDILARELKVVLVISAGNHNEATASNTSNAETALMTFPGLLFNSLTGICDPATAAIALTVGSLSQHSTSAIPLGSNAGDISRPFAGVNEPSPFTRIGPGINGAIKPEIVHYGGNLVFTGFGSLRRIQNEPGTAVMSFSHQPTQQLFAYDCGTSFAAPRVARLAALIEHGLRADLGERPTPNLIRAVLASTADIPIESIRLLETYDNGRAALKVCGYGLPSDSDALKSHNRRVTMVYQGVTAIDHFNVFAVPIPDVFRYVKGDRKIIVALAYDPPVRRRRLDDYTGVAMEFFLIRGQGIDQVNESFIRNPSGYDIGSKYRMKFDLNSSTRKTSTLQRAECIMKRAEVLNRDYGNEYYLVIRCERKWAPSDIENQDFGIAVTLCANDEQLYNQVALRIRQRARVRV